MTNAVKHIYRQLDGLGIYALDGSSLVDCELLAYDAAFAVLEELLEEIRLQAMIQTSTGEGLRAHERLVGLGQREGLSDDIRRDLILYRLSVAPFDFTAEGMVRSMRAAGLDGQLTEHSPEERITVRSNAFIDRFEDLDSLKARLSEMLPAHLDWEFDTGYLTWDMFDSREVVWDRWDGLDFTWDMFDVDGHNILKFT